MAHQTGETWFLYLFLCVRLCICQWSYSCINFTRVCVYDVHIKSSANEEINQKAQVCVCVPH